MDIHGADQLAALAKALKEAGDKDLQRELFRGINRAVKPVKAAIKTSAGTLPTRGGLAAQIAATKLSTRRRTSGKAVGVRVVGKNRFSLYHLNKGEIRHPIKGKPAAAWTIQPWTPGWWDKPTEATGPDARRELEQALQDVAKKIDRAV